MHSMSSAKDLIWREYPVVVEQAVAWGDMDSFKHVNNVVYFRYFENARLEYFRRLDWFTFQEQSGVGPIVSATQARYRRALTYPDTIFIGARLLTLEENRFTLEHRLVSERLDDIASTGQVTVVAYHYREGHKTQVPEEIRRRIAALEAAVQSAAKEPRGCGPVA
jgi:acyl-CoA thioester hydrolase